MVMFSKYSFVLSLFLIIFLGVSTVEAQTSLPNKGKTEGSKQADKAERDSILKTRKTKKGKEIRPFFIPYLSGGFDANSNASLFSIGITPVVGIAIDKFRVAAGPSFEYTRIRSNSITDTYRGLGFLSFAEYNIINIGGGRNSMMNETKIFAHVEYSFNNIKQVESGVSQNISSFPIGAGFSQPMGGRTSLYGVILYDVLNTNSPYTYNGLTYRFGLGVGF